MNIYRFEVDGNIIGEFVSNYVLKNVSGTLSDIRENDYRNKLFNYLCFHYGVSFQDNSIITIQKINTVDQINFPLLNRII